MMKGLSAKYQQTHNVVCGNHAGLALAVLGQPPVLVLRRLLNGQHLALAERQVLEWCGEIRRLEAKSEEEN